jgi:hypothetical protein
MTDKLRAAAQAAYRAMISAELSDGSRREWEAAVDGLKDALAEPAIKESLTVAEPEPVGQLQEGAYGRGQVLWFNKPADQSMLYTAPPRREWVGLKDDEIKEVANSCVWSETYHVDFSRAIEAKLREKNEK